MSNTSLSFWLHAYFHEWLGEQRSCSPHTVHSYRDTWRLFLRFVAESQKTRVSALQLKDLDAEQVRAFLKHYECERQTSIGTRNCRLAAIRSFYRFVADREPMAALQCAAVLLIPVKRGPRVEPAHLDSDEVGAILRQPDKATPEGQRDHALLALLYNAGARIQEALDLRPRDLRLTAPAYVKLRGKGRKERMCPIWPETASLLAALFKRQPRPEGEPMFVNCYGRPLGAAGVRFKLAQYVQSAAMEMPSLDGKRIHPHTFRHTAGVQLVAAGVDVTVIRSWFGHVSLDTTNHYARASVETKRKALERMDPPNRPGTPPRWRRNRSFLHGWMRCERVVMRRVE